MKISHLVRKIGIIVITAVMCLAFVGGNYAWAGDETPAEGEDSSTSESPVKIDPEKENQCATILKDWCEDAKDKSKGGETIENIIKFAISILSIGIGVLATIGIIVCGYLIMSARDNEAQVQKAKKRLLEIVIGVVLWALGALVLLLIIPDSEAAEHVHDGADEGAVVKVKEIG